MKMMNNGYNSSFNSNSVGLMSTAATTAASSSSSTSTTNTNSQSQGLKTYFKTPEGRYKLHYEKTHPPGFPPFSHGKSVSQVTLAQLKDKPAQAGPTPSLSSSTSASSGVRYAAAKFLGVGGGNGVRAIGFAGGNGSGKAINGTSRSGSLAGSNGSHSILNPNYDGKGTYLIFNVGDTIFIGDLNSPDKDPIKSLHFSNSNPICHAFDPEAKDGHDLLIGLNSGDVDVSALHGFQKVTSKDGSVDSTFPVIKDQTQFSVAHARSSKSNPIARWHICQGSINNVAFSTDGVYLATVGRDGYLRVFDYLKEQLICGGKSYYGALLCCTWSGDGKYILTGGEDDLVTVWSMEDRKVVAWGEGHNSWVSGVAFDSYWSSPASDDTEENVVYRFGSVGQDTQLLLWDLSMDEIVVPLRRCPPGGSPTFSAGSQSAHWDSITPLGTLQPAPCMRDVPKLSPVVAHRVHTEPLSGIIFTQESILTACREGHVKIWMRPSSETQSSNSEPLVCSSMLAGPKVGSSTLK
ncbi:creC [Cucurbita argyrosperma subsp. argyrosperma]|nr:creC [Cucurbita argyrosperma subsp. argyrosperma]